VRGLGPEGEALLATYEGPEPDRVRRAIVSLAHDDEGELRILVKAARVDYRDVLAWEQEQRLGPAQPVDVESLMARLDPGSDPPAVGNAATVSVVLIDPGAGGADLLKAIRRAGELGLADVAALVHRTPVTIVDNLDLTEASGLKAELETLGATVEVR